MAGLLRPSGGASVLQTRLGSLLGPRCPPLLVASLPVDVPGCRPHLHATTTCAFGAGQQQLQGREARVGHYTGGLSRYVRQNAASPGSTQLQLTVLPPGPHPAHGAPRSSVQVQLLHQQDAGPGVVQAVHQHTARNGAWVGSLAAHASATQYRQLAAAATMGQSATGAPGRAVALAPQSRAEGSHSLETPLPAPAGTSTAAAAAANPVPACPSTSLQDSPSALRVLRTIKYSRKTISISAAFATALTDRCMNTPGDKVPVPIYVPGSEPRSFLPDSCYVRTEPRNFKTKAGVRCLVGGLGAFLLYNRAVEGSTLLLTAVPPDPARGYPTPSLAVQLIRHKDVESAVQEGQSSTSDAQGGRHADLTPFLAADRAEGQFLSPTGRAGAGGAGRQVSVSPHNVGRRRSLRLAKGPRVSGEQTVEQRLSMMPEGLDQVHVEAVRAFLQAAADRKAARMVQPSMLTKGMCNVRNAFAAALGAQWQQGAKPDRVRVPVLQCYPVGASSSLKETYLRGAWIAGQVFTVWVACGFKPWLADVGAEANDLLLVWAVEAGLEAGEAGKEGEGAVGGGGGCRGLGLRVHLVRRADVGSDKLEALVGLVCVW